MPDHTLIKDQLKSIFQLNEEFFNTLKNTKNFDAYRNAFIALGEEDANLNHFFNCFSSLAKTCIAAKDHIEKTKPKQPSTLPIAMNCSQIMELLGSKYQIFGSREKFKNRVEAAGFERNKTFFTREEVEWLTDHVVKNFNRKKQQPNSK